ncbi:glycosyl hydrolase family 61-domain-containing protein [Cercophora newfieldiana]|uniref:lytic cellulose monooxygenase (C4-dehydrogenating) n=1 Tax=Cercophora newfieldiana TaxID=92897 RepID=A0AA40CXU4_9PEZI|nr:glycosyl hydrolase family 61-domain-containing protein [Cercophora newfieldiana]
MISSTSILSALGLASFAAAHSHIAYININGLKYEGYDPRSIAGPISPNRVVWSHNAPDDGWINFSDYLSPNMACHRDAKSVPAHAVVRAGDNIAAYWAGWPLNHPGPVFSYLAPCTGTNDGCASVDKTKLQWTKIDDSAPVLISPDGPSPGTWATNILIGNNNTWQIHIPSGLKPGPYVLRHEIIALHYASNPTESGAQHYPICINIYVLPPAPGTFPLPFSLKGVPATKLYERNHPGLVIDVYQPLSTYQVPGPTVAPNAQPVPHARQTSSAYNGDGKPVKVEGTRTVPFVAKRTAAVGFAA